MNYVHFLFMPLRFFCVQETIFSAFFCYTTWLPGFTGTAGGFILANDQTQEILYIHRWLTNLDGCSGSVRRPMESIYATSGLIQPGCHRPQQRPERAFGLQAAMAWL